jgi:ribonuclease-3
MSSNSTNKKPVSPSESNPSEAEPSGVCSSDTSLSIDRGLSTDRGSSIDAGCEGPIQGTKLEACQQAIGYRFRNLQFLQTSLRHASGVSDRLESNERLEFLGDAILGLVVCERLFVLYPEYLEGDLTKIKSVVVSRETCARMSDVLGLKNYLALGKGMASGPKIPRSVVAAVFESMIAAIHLDGGIDAAKEFILKQVEPEIEMAVSGESGDNFKSLLQQFAQREHGVTPNYQLLDEKGPDHSKCFKISALVGSRRFPAAWGRSKKESEQRAAHNAISDLQDQPIPYSSEDQS